MRDRKNVVRTTLQMLDEEALPLLEQDEMSLYELLAEHGIAERVARTFNIDPRSLTYRGPVLVGWQRFTIPSEGREESRVKKRRTFMTRAQRRHAEKIYWLGIVPRNIIDLAQPWAQRLLASQPEARALLLRHGLDLFIDEAPCPSLPGRHDPRVVVRTLTAYQDGTLEASDDYDLARDLDLGDGRRSYLFWYGDKPCSILLSPA